MKSILALLLLLAATSFAWAAGIDIATLTKKAEAGEAEAQFQLAGAYEKGDGVQQDENKAFEWCRKAAEQGYAQAQNSLGVMYSRGIGVEKNKEEAFHWYQKAARQSLAKGDYNVAISYYNGDGVSSDLARAYAWMMLAQRNGDPDAEQALAQIRTDLHDRVVRSKVYLANLYLNGEEIPADPTAGVAIFREVADADLRGDDPSYGSAAQYRMCQLYAAGKGVPQDYAEAKSWCKKAAKNHHNFAFIVLARMAEQGLGQPVDLKEAEVWYRDAALLNTAEAYLQLGKLKMQTGSHDDEKDAYFWLFLAQQFKVKEAAPLFEQAAARLTTKEIESEKKKNLEWRKVPWNQRLAELKFP